LGCRRPCGARLFADIADATGLSGLMQAALAPLRQRRLGHGPGWVALDVAVMLADGGEAIADVAVRATPTGQVGHSWRGCWRCPTRRQ
jgi:hypothetical protein